MNLGVLLVLTVVVIFLIKNLLRKPRQGEIPEAWGLPYLGSALWYAIWGGEYFIWAKKRYGKIYKLNLAGTRVIMVNDNKFLEPFYKWGVEFASFTGVLDFFALKHVMGPAGFVEEDHGNPVIPLMRGNFAPNTRHLTSTVVEIMNKFMDRALSPDGGHIADFGRGFCTKLYVELAVIILGGRDIYEAHGGEVMQHVMDLEILARQLITATFPNPLIQKCKQIRAREEAIIRECIEKRLSGATPKQNDFLQVMIDDGKQTVNELTERVGGLFFAVLSNTQAAFLQLCLNIWHRPQLMEKIKDEMKKALAETNGEVTFQYTQKLELMEATLTEILRLIATPIHLRKALATFEYDGYTIPENSLFAVSPYVVHHDPEIFEDPYTFKPERFLTSKPQLYTWLPFGLGKHKCLGQYFAIMAAKVGFTLLMQRFDWKLDIKEIPKPDFIHTLGVAWPKNPVPVTYSPK